MEEKKEKKCLKTATKIKIAILGMAATVLGFVLLINYYPDGKYEIGRTETITVTDGKADPAGFSETLNIEKSGKYQIHAEWGDWQNYDPATQSGFITVFTLKNPEGLTLFETTGESLSVDSIDYDLDKGSYSLEFKFRCSQEEPDKYCEEHQYKNDSEPADLFKNGSWERRFVVFAKDNNDKLGSAIAVCLGVLFGLFLVSLIVALGTMGRKAGAPKYDERQIAEQGKSYKYGFFTALIICALHLVFDMAGIDHHLEKSVMLLIIIVVPVAVAATHMILHDAYFQLNENRKFMTISLAIIGICNLFFAIKEIADGKFIVDGVVTFLGACNLIAALMLFYIIVILGIKAYLDKKEE